MGQTFGNHLKATVYKFVNLVPFKAQDNKLSQVTVHNFRTFNQAQVIITLNQVKLHKFINFGAINQSSWVIALNQVMVYTFVNLEVFNQPQVIKLNQVTMFTFINFEAFNQS